MKLDTITPISGHVVDTCACDNRLNLHVPSQIFREKYILPLLPSKINLKEATYKELGSMIDGNFLNQQIRTKQLESVIFDHFDNDTMHFRVKSSEYEKNKVTYDASVKFLAWDEIGQDRDLNFVERARMMLWLSDIQLNCTDPSFLYWGYQYLLTVIDASIYPEERKPVIRNPTERGIVCKHLNLALSVLPFNNQYIARELRNQFSE